MLFRRKHTPIGASVIRMRGMGDDGYGDSSSENQSSSPVSVFQIGARSGIPVQARKQAKRINAAQKKQIQDYIKNRALAVQRQAIAERALALRAAQIRAAQQGVTPVSPIEPTRILGPSTPIQSMVVAKQQSMFTPNVEFNQSQKDFEANYARTLPVQELNDMYLRTGDSVAKTELDRRGPAAEVVDLEALENSQPLDAIGALTRYASKGIPKRPESDYEFTVEAPDIQVNPLELLDFGKNASSSVYRAVKGLPSLLPDITVDQWLKENHDEVPNYDPTSWLPDFSKARKPVEEESFADNINRLRNSGRIKSNPTGGGFFDVYAGLNNTPTVSLPVFEKSVHEKVFADVDPELLKPIYDVKESQRQSEKVWSEFLAKSNKPVDSGSPLDSLASLYASTKDKISEGISSGAERIATELISGEVKSRLDSMGIPSDSVKVTQASYDPSSGNAKISINAPGGVKVSVEANYSNGNVRIDKITSNQKPESSSMKYSGDIKRDAINYVFENKDNQITQLVAEYNSGGHGKAPFQNWDSSEYDAPQDYLKQTRDGALRVGNIIRDFSNQFADAALSKVVSDYSRGAQFDAFGRSVSISPDAVRDIDDIARSQRSKIIDYAVERLTPKDLIDKADRLIRMKISKGDDATAKAYGYSGYKGYANDLQKTDEAIRGHYKDTIVAAMDVKKIIDRPGDAESKFAAISQRLIGSKPTAGLDAIAGMTQIGQ